MTSRFAQAVLISRCVLVTIGLILLANLTWCDALVAGGWRVMRAWWVVHLDTFEPLVASLSFAIWIWLFRLVDTAVPRARSFRIDPRSAPAAGDWSAFDGHHLLSALVAYLAPLAVFDWLWPRRSLPIAPPTAVALIGGVVAALIVYDFLFFWLHVVLHKWPAVQYLHRPHHQQSVMRAAETLRLSFVDGALQVGCSIAALHLVRAHPMTRSLFNVVITYWLCEIHSRGWRTMSCPLDWLVVLWHTSNTT